MSSSLVTLPVRTLHCFIHHRCTEKVDIYSFGVVLWEIVTQVRLACLLAVVLQPRVRQTVPKCMDDRHV